MVAPIDPEPPGGLAKLRVLLACLLAACLALLVVHRPWFGLGGEGAAATGPRCAARAPAVASIPLGGYSRLSAAVAGIVPETVGRRYESGYVTTGVLWSDNEPTPGGGGRGIRLPAAYEVRWWALDRRGREDDVVADVLEFSTPQRAREALALAADPSCHPPEQHATAHLANRLTGAHELSWTNPDAAHQWDALLVRGRLLYRISDVPAQDPSGHATRRLDDATTSTVEALACTLPQAGCPRVRAAAAHTALAIGVHSRIGPRSGATPSRAEAAAFARAVTIRRSEVPGLSPAGSERPSREGGETGSCSREAPLTHAIASAKSPTYRGGGRGRYEQVSSGVAVLHDESLAARYVTLLAGKAERTCIGEHLHAYLLRFARRRGLRVGPVGVRVPRPGEVPRSYRPGWPFRASALRVTLELGYRAHARSRAGATPVSYSAAPPVRRSLRMYAEIRAIAYGRAVITLTTFSLPLPYYEDSRRYLESALLARAETFSG